MTYVLDEDDQIEQTFTSTEKALKDLKIASNTLNMSTVCILSYMRNGFNRLQDLTDMSDATASVEDTDRCTEILNLALKLLRCVQQLHTIQYYTDLSLYDEKETNMIRKLISDIQVNFWVKGHIQGIQEIHATCIKPENKFGYITFAVGPVDKKMTYTELSDGCWKVLVALEAYSTVEETKDGK